jgi:hypothetical protein
MLFQDFLSINNLGEIIERENFDDLRLFSIFIMENEKKKTDEN